MPLMPANSSGERYLVEGALLLCQAGSAVNELKLPDDHGCYDAAGKPLINIKDSNYDENIPNFGTCSISGEPCIPNIVGDWNTTNTTMIVGGASAVTTTSCLVCSKGAFILPESSGQADPDALLELLMLMTMLGLQHGIFCLDPVNICTGNFVDQKTDLQISGSYPLSLKRTYNAMDKRCGVLGRGWRHSFEIWLDDKKDCIEVTLEDGRVEAFYLDSGGRYLGVDKSYIQTSSFKTYTLVTKEEERYTFDTSGRCTGICDKYGLETTFRYEDSRLTWVENVSGNISFSYDEGNRLTSVTDNGGRTVYYAYDQYGTLGSVENVLGIKTEYKYDKENRLMTAIGSSGEPNFINSYDKHGRVEKQYFADGGVASLAYDEQWLKTTMTEQNGNRVRYYQNERLQNIKTVYYDGHEETDYDDKGKRTRFRDKNGNESFYEYDAAGNMVSEMNPLGEQTKLEYNRENLPTKITAANEGVVTLSYDKHKNLTSVTNPLGLLTQMAYHKGLPSQVDFPDGSRLGVIFDEKLNVSSIRTPTGGNVTYEYDNLNRVVATTDGLGHTTKYAYNAKDKLTQVTNSLGQTQNFAYTPGGKIAKITDFDGSTVEYEYNYVGKVEEIINQAGNSTKFTYDLMWNVTSVEDACGNTTKYEYDKLKRLTVSEDTEGNKTKYEYDPKGNMTAVISPLGARTEITYDALDRQVKVTQADGAVTEFSYDSVGNLIQVTDAMGNAIYLSYDKAGQLIEEVNALGEYRIYTYTPLGKVASITDEAGRETYYRYALGGLLERVCHPDKTEERFAYNYNGNVECFTDRLGQNFTYTYDSLDRIVEIVDRQGNAKQYSYDAVGNVTSMTDERGHTTSYTYTSTGKLAKVVDPLGNESQYTYDACDRLIEVSQAESLDEALSKAMALNKENQKPTTRYSYNANGQLVESTDALGNTERYTYDAVGQLTEKFDKDGYLTRFGYTVRGDLNHIQYADGRDVKLYYNPLRQLTEVEDWLGKTRIELDPLGRTTKVVNHQDREVAYTWGSAGIKTSMTYPDGKHVAYQYDDLLRLTAVSDGKNSTKYLYDRYGRPTEKIFSTGETSRYFYNAMGRLQAFQHSDNHNVLEHYQFAYDVMGNKTEVCKMRHSMDMENGVYAYSYDPLNRLQSVMKDGVSLRSYSYDGYGNRTKMAEGSKETTYAYNELNQLVFTADNLGFEQQYSYDKRGNLTELYKGGAVANRYVYGALNRLEQAVNLETGQQAYYRYNGLGHRVGKSVAGNLTPELPTAGMTKQIDDVLDLTRQYYNLLERRENDVATSYVWDGNLAFSTSGNKATAYLLDELGSPLRMGRFELYGYDEFGNSLYDMPEGKQPFGFTGYQSDAVAGTWYAQAREYLPQLGRFAGEDKITGFAAFPQSLNCYGYCWNNPLSLVDLDGEWPQWMRDAGQAAANFWNTHIYGVETTVVNDLSIGNVHNRQSVTTHVGGSIFVRQVTVENGAVTGGGFSVGTPDIAGNRISTGVSWGGGTIGINASTALNISGARFQSDSSLSIGGSDLIRGEISAGVGWGDTVFGVGLYTGFNPLSGFVPGMDSFSGAYAFSFDVPNGLRQEFGVRTQFNLGHVAAAVLVAAGIVYGAPLIAGALAGLGGVLGPLTAIFALVVLANQNGGICSE